jgi:hypothetical protein
VDVEGGKIERTLENGMHVFIGKNKDVIEIETAIY